MRTPPWLQSLIPRLQSLQSLLSRSLSRLLPPCPRRWPSPQLHSQTVHLAAYERPKPPYPEQKNPESWGSVGEGEGNLMAEAGAPGFPGGGFGVAWPTLRLLGGLFGLVIG